MQVITRPTRAVVAWFNRIMVTLRSWPLVGPIVCRRLTVISYVGRRSGQVFSTPVAYRRVGDLVTIGVQFPDRKRWWRNFTGPGGTITLELDGVTREGHAIARRDDRGSLTVTVRPF